MTHETEQTASDTPKRKKPGVGWSKLSQSVYEHVSGIRIHCFGLVQLPTGERFWLNRWPDCLSIQRTIDEQGGNKRRGLMVWALTSLRTKGAQAK